MEGGGYMHHIDIVSVSRHGYCDFFGSPAFQGFAFGAGNASAVDSKPLCTQCCRTLSSLTSEP